VIVCCVPSRLSKHRILYLCVHPNIGIARCPADGVSTEALLANAEFAMRLAKQHKTVAFVDEH